MFVDIPKVQGCSRLLSAGAATVKYGMGSRKHLAVNKWKRARKGLLQKERWDDRRES